MWDSNDDVEENTLDVFISLLRNKVDRDHKVKLIQTVRGTGYTIRDATKISMMTLPIRLRLTAWYFAVLAVVLSAFGVSAYLEMRHSIRQTVDEELQIRAEGVHQLIERTIQRGAEDDLQEGLREHTELRQGGALLQVSDEQGNWLYRSPVMSDYGVPRPATIPRRATEFMGKDVPLRIWTLESQRGRRVLHHPVRI